MAHARVEQRRFASSRYRDTSDIGDDLSVAAANFGGMTASNNLLE